jgi:hypothetical protein
MNWDERRPCNVMGGGIPVKSGHNCSDDIFIISNKNVTELRPAHHPEAFNVGLLTCLSRATMAYRQK